MNGFSLHPALFFIGGAVLIPFLKNRLQHIYMLILPVLAFLSLITLANGEYWQFSFLQYQITPGHLDNLSRIFLYIFSIITFIAVLFALNSGDTVQFVSAFIYAGGALGVTLAGDFFTLYVFWEVMAIASTFLILARKTKSAQTAAFRYVLVHLFGGLCLLAGIMLHVMNTGSIELAHLELTSLSAVLIFVGVAVNAAVPPLHPWLKDAYPEATVAGSVFLSAFTTKSAVYVMARLFAGTPHLIYLGAFMTVFPIFYAVLENDIRRVLSYSLINQVGFMLCGVGIGTTLAINGTAAHAVGHI
ncbi:proton-conducting transporter membrane subunit [Desulfobacterales bacterium HSG17]|nr:proton-conducting transporter membrane subunit [Desulfobacterales bacterium HSG17]